MPHLVAEVNFAKHIDGMAQSMLANQGNSELLDHPASSTVRAHQIARFNLVAFPREAIFDSRSDSLLELFERLELCAKANVCAAARRLGEQ